MASSTAEKEGDRKSKKKTKIVRMPEPHIEYLLSPASRSEPLPLLDLDEKLLEDFKALIPNGEAFLAETGFSLESYRQLATIDDGIEKAEAEFQAEIREQYASKGYVEMEVTDDDEEEETVVPPPPARSRRRFRPGVTKKAGGAVKKSN
ncbi:hypothetical protein BRADI_1g78165v3 [Brachypodium distachyon]|uniref:Uncharacterized protein n=1 Tax=Brachypodium distachyon TaxID=15368 RepID=I1HAS3_BRADI|nr:hypothetical protein BRADI_1g78165v3 [Brachypodium distachyon]PNT78370.1 hypothetical protein BRADI_1g78165v3 [Brachypodium distachyon]